MSFDIAMPLTLFAVTLASLLLNQKTEEKLKGTFEEKEFKTKDAVMLVGVFIVMISVIVFLREMVAPLMILFMFSYSMLLFIFTYILSNKRWYMAVLPPVAFIIPYLLLKDTAIWSNYLISMYGVVFAILITLYIANVFTWKATLVFTALLTVVDIILVLVTGTMIEAASTAMSLKLPVMVIVPRIPLEFHDGAMGIMALGLGDFFFAGLLAIQTHKKYGRRTAILSIVTMTVSFFIFEAAILLDVLPRTFPGTLMIICGWIPLAGGKMLLKRLRRAKNGTIQQQRSTSRVES